MAKTIPFRKIYKKLKKKQPEVHHEIKTENIIFGILIKKYKKEGYLPNFDRIEDYSDWLETKAGKKHLKRMEEFDKIAHAIYKKLYKKKKSKKKLIPIDFKISQEAFKLLKKAKKQYGVSQSVILDTIIKKGLGDPDFLNPKDFK